MSTSAKRFVLDANAFIQSKRKFYAFDICPGYWTALIWHQTRNLVCSIDRVKDELERGGDDLWEWARSQTPEGFFAATDEPEVIRWYGQMVGWVQVQSQFHPEAKAEFSETENADAWLVAYAKRTGSVLVTLEEYDPAIRKKVPIPNVCREFVVDYVTPFDMLRSLSVHLNWQPPVG